MENRINCYEELAKMKVDCTGNENTVIWSPDSGFSEKENR